MGSAAGTVRIFAQADSFEPGEAPAAAEENMDMRIDAGDRLVDYEVNVPLCDSLARGVKSLLGQRCIEGAESRSFVFTGLSGTGKTRSLLELPGQLLLRLGEAVSSADGVYVGFNKSQLWDTEVLRPPAAALDSPDTSVEVFKRWLARRLVLLMRSRAQRPRRDAEGAADVFYAPSRDQMLALVRQTARSRILANAEQDPSGTLTALLDVPSSSTGSGPSGPPPPRLFLILVDEVQVLHRKDAHRAVLRAARQLQVEVSSKSEGRVCLVTVATGVYAGDFSEPSEGAAGITSELGAKLYLSIDARRKIARKSKGKAMDAPWDWNEERFLFLTYPQVRPLVQNNRWRIQALATGSPFGTWTPCA